MLNREWEKKKQSGKKGIAGKGRLPLKLSHLETQPGSEGLNQSMIYFTTFHLRF